MERLAAADDGRLEVTGRWFGVRGRRFVRPALIVTLGLDGPEQRWLADLDHKPWAAEDGQPWTAVFPVEVDLERATAIELSVAPDIEIALQSPAGEREAAGASAVAQRSRSPMAKHDPDTRRPSARAQDLERLTTRLSASEAALERERARRAELEQTLEEQRTEARTLSAQLGRARAELDLAQTVQRENEAMSADLDSARRELRAVQDRHQALSDEHDRVIEAHGRTESELRERSGALESARDALDEKQRRSEELLAAERAHATEALERTRAAHDEDLAAERSRGSEELSAERARAAERLREAQTRAAAAAQPTQASPRVETPDPDRTEARPPRRPGEHSAERPVDVRGRPTPAPRVDRPVNPALRSRPNWFWRIVAVLVFAAVIVAVYLVLHSTILHH